MKVTGDLPANLSYLARGPVFPSTLPFQNNLPPGLSHLVQSPPSPPSLWSRFTSLVGRAPIGQQFLVWGGLGGLGLQMFFGSEKGFFGNLLSFGLSIAGLATLIPGMQCLILPIAAIYAARGLFTMATGEGFMERGMGLLDLACAIPGYSIFKNWKNISQAATSLASRTGISTLANNTGISTAHAYARTIATDSFGPAAGRQVSWVASAFRNPREAFGNLAESSGRGLSYYWGRFTDGARNAAPPIPGLMAGAGI